MSAPVVRVLQPDDIPVIAEWMLVDPLWQRYAFTVDQITADFELALSRGDIALTVDTDQPARAFAWCLPNGMFGASPYLKRIGVDPACTSKGIGSSMLQQLERLLLDRGQRDLFLLVSHFNIDAQRFYRRHGYLEIGRIPDLSKAGVTEVLFRKQLARLL